MCCRIGIGILFAGLCRCEIREIIIGAESPYGKHFIAYSEHERNKPGLYIEWLLKDSLNHSAGIAKMMKFLVEILDLHFIGV